MYRQGDVLVQPIDRTQVPAGAYRVVRQREYLPGTWHPVAD
jgi:hypothetical protein